MGSTGYVDGGRSTAEAKAKQASLIGDLPEVYLQKLPRVCSVKASELRNRKPVEENPSSYPSRYPEETRFFQMFASFRILAQQPPCLSPLLLKRNSRSPIFARFDKSPDSRARK